MTWAWVTWDPVITLGEWWRRLADSGLAVPRWPVEWLGRDRRITGSRAMARARDLGLSMLGPVRMLWAQD